MFHHLNKVVIQVQTKNVSQTLLIFDEFCAIISLKIRKIT